MPILVVQSIGVLSPEPEPLAVARFLRHCPGLSKSSIGELLGEPDDFFLAVLACFTHTFDFTGAACPRAPPIDHARTGTEIRTN